MLYPVAPVCVKLYGFVLSNQNNRAILKDERQLTVEPLGEEPLQDFCQAV
jgi:hypothetical protein